ncbi:MAG: hypothetical protein ACLSG7_06330 [Clostridia bacterium]
MDNDERIVQDLTDKILKKFWMTMSEQSKIWQTKFKKFWMTMSEQSERKER